MVTTTNPGVETFQGPGQRVASVLFVITWYMAVVIIRMHRFLTKRDRNVSGFLPVLSNVIEHYDYTDGEWVNAHSLLAQDIIVVGHFGLIRQDFSWRRQGRWGYPLTHLEWRKIIHFGPPGIQTAPAELFHTRQPRLSDNADLYETMKSNIYTLQTSNGRVIRADSRSDRELHKLLERSDQVILMYGLNFLAIPNGYCEEVNLRTVQEREFSSLLFTTALAISVLLVARSWWFLSGFTLMALIPLYRIAPQGLKDAVGIDRFIQVVNQDDRRFSERVSRDAVNIEVASRVMRDEFLKGDPHGRRTIDVILFYENRWTWCRCQPNTPGNDPLGNTWIEFCIPTQTPWRNRMYYFIYRLVNTIVPWGHNANWVHNLIYAVAVALAAPITHFFTPKENASFLAATITYIAIWIPKWMPNLSPSPWGEGDVTVVAWYMLLLRIVLGRTLDTPVLKIIIFIWGTLKGLGVPIPALPSWLNATTAVVTPTAPRTS